MLCGHVLGRRRRVLHKLPYGHHFSGQRSAHECFSMHDLRCRLRWIRIGHRDKPDRLLAMPRRQVLGRGRIVLHELPGGHFLRSRRCAHERRGVHDLRAGLRWDGDERRCLQRRGLHDLPRGLVHGDRQLGDLHELPGARHDGGQRLGVLRSVRAVRRGLRRNGGEERH